MLKCIYYFNRCTKCKEKIHLSGGQIMAISLFEHNETAYYAALSMMKTSFSIRCSNTKKTCGNATITCAKTK